MSPFEEIQQSIKEESLRGIVNWWEKRRLWFNLAVGASGLCSLLIFRFANMVEPWILLFGIFFYGFLANVFYTLGWATDIYLRVIFKERFILTGWKNILFIGGTFLSVVITFILAFIFQIELIFLD